MDLSLECGTRGFIASDFAVRLFGMLSLFCVVYEPTFWIFVLFSGVLWGSCIALFVNNLLFLRGVF